MSNAPHDLRDYVLDELTPDQRAEVERYLASSVEAREEVERLRLTHQALLSMPEEEPPRRIAFVSDKVFEPSPWRRAWQGFWQGAPRLAFGLAAVLLVFFVGAWATQPTVVSDQNGWRVAFGQQPEAPEPVVPAERVEQSVADARLSPAEIRQVLELIQQDQARQQEALAELVRSQVSGSDREMRQAIEAVAQDYDIIKSRVDSIYRETVEFQMASVGR